MSIIKTWDNVPFELELRITGHYHVNKDGGAWQSYNDEYWNEIRNFADRTRNRINELYNHLKISEPLAGGYRERGPKLYGETNPRTFKEIFGKNIARGISLVMPPVPILLPFAPLIGNFFTQWYKIGDLVIPKNLDDLVKEVSLSRPAIGSFMKFNLWVPYGVRN